MERLAQIFLDLQAQGAHNINLVTPGQWQPWIIAALTLARDAGLDLPIVCNTGGYETPDRHPALAGLHRHLAGRPEIRLPRPPRPEMSAAPRLLCGGKAGHRGHDGPDGAARSTAPTGCCAAG